MVSRPVPVLIRIPCCAPFPKPTITAVGVARPRAQGHAATITAVVNRKETSQVTPPMNNHARNVAIAITMTRGTKTSAIASARR